MINKQLKFKLNDSLIVLLFALAFIGCGNSNREIKHSEELLIPDPLVTHAKLFSFSSYQGARIIHVFGHKNSKDTTLNLILYSKDKPDLILKNAYFIKTPCSRVVSLSSIYTTMLCEVGAIENIVGIENADYYSNEKLLNLVNEGKIKELQKNPLIDREATLMLKPDIIFAFGMGSSDREFDQKIIESGIPVIMSIDHLEKTPLARAEWIKFFAAFVDQSQSADSIFNRVSKDYTNLVALAKQQTAKPTVFTELKFGDTWYVPSGKSYMAELIKDANAEYLWRSDTSSGSLPLSFESVYTKASTADFWINVSMCQSLNDIIAQDKRYADFSAFKNKTVYNNNKYKNKFNYTTYWETGMVFPNKILSDLIHIFHSKRDSAQKNLYYYDHLN